MLEYLRLTRAHTAPLEAVPAIMGAALAVGTIWDINIALWAVVGILYHLAGYGHNSVEDWERGYDKNDEHKQHLPLNKGTISLKQAKYFIYGLITVTFVLTTALSFSSVTAMTAIYVAILFGVLYNTVGKETEFKFIFISIAHSMLFVIPYAALGGNIRDPVFITGWIAVILWVAYQISVSGEIKDIMQDESNFLTDVLDTHVYETDEFVKYGGITRIYSISLKMAGLSMIILTWLLQEYPLILNPLSLEHGLWFGFIGVISVLIWIFDDIMLRSWLNYKRHTDIRQMSRIEMFTLIAFTLAFVPVIGWLSATLVIWCSIIWVFAGNMLLWGTVLVPEV